MTVPTDDRTAAVAVTGFLQTVKAMRADLVDKRAAVSASGQLPAVAFQRFMRDLPASVAYVDTLAASSGFNAEFQNAKPARSGFNATAEWAAAKTALQALHQWLLDNWPAKATITLNIGAGATPTVVYAFSYFPSPSLQETYFTLTLTAGQKNALVAQLDTAIAAFAQD